VPELSPTPEGATAPEGKPEGYAPPGEQKTEGSAVVPTETAAAPTLEGEQRARARLYRGLDRVRRQASTKTPRASTEGGNGMNEESPWTKVVQNFSGGAGLGNGGQNSGDFGGGGMWSWLLIPLLFGGFFGNRHHDGHNPHRDESTWHADQHLSDLIGAQGTNITNLINAATTTSDRQFAGVNLLTTNLTNASNGLARDLQRDTARDVAGVAARLQECCDETQRRFDQVECQIGNARQEIIKNQDANTQRVLDKLSAQEVQGLRDTARNQQDVINIEKTKREVVDAMATLFGLEPPFPIGVQGMRARGAAAPA
jgi:hypothetical protein